MKSLTLEEIKALGPCWLETAEGREKFRRIGSRKDQWTALDVLELPKEEVCSEDKLWLVLREEFLSARTLHLFACETAEQALGKIENPDPRSTEAIRVKRLWLDGKATNEELAIARADANAVARAEANAATRAAALAAKQAETRAIVRDVAQSAAWAVAEGCRMGSSWGAAQAIAQAAALKMAQNEQIQILLRLIEKEEKD